MRNSITAINQEIRKEDITLSEIGLMSDGNVIHVFTPEGWNRDTLLSPVEKLMKKIGYEVPTRIDKLMKKMGYDIK
jgi:hypothetical protein